MTPTSADPPEEQLKLLARYLDSERGGLLIVVSPDVEAERALVAELRLRVQDDVHLETVSFVAEPVASLSLSHHLSTLPPRQGKAAVLVFGLDDLPAEARTTAINAMNWGRERVRQSGYSVVLWVRPGTPGDLGNRAPDFFSWRGNVFEFDVPTEIGDRQQMLARLRLFAPASLDELRQRYNEYVIRTCQWVDLRGVLQMRNIVRLPLAEVFVPLQATIATETFSPIEIPTETEDLTTDVGSGRLERMRIERRIALADAVRQHQHLVILGDPGAGKSTLLRFLALTYAQGPELVRQRFGVAEQRLPVLVPLAAFSEAQSTQPDMTLAAFLPQYFLKQGLPDFSPILTEALTRERAVVLLDGLDEMLTTQNRAAVAQAISAFSRDYPAVRIAVTSRIAGYTSGLLPGHFATVTIAPFDDAEIAHFARQWSLAFEASGLPLSELPADARQRAERRATQLTTAATSHPGVKRLATNPLLLTLLALIHYQGTRLPNRRADLYRLCVEALAETWNLARSLSGKAIDLYLGNQRLDEEFVVSILGPVAYWMHEYKPTGLIERTELEARIAEHFVEKKGAPAAEARTSAHDFVTLAREQMGLLVERAPDLFGFLHLSFQEYLAARFLSERIDTFARLKPHLHQPRWREVVLLTAGCLRGDYASQFVENILNAYSDYDDLLHRDLLLAAHCIGDEIAVPLQLRQRIRDQLFALWKDPPFPRLQEEIVKTFAYLKHSQIDGDIRNFLLTLLQDRKEKTDGRRKAAEVLGQLDQGNAEVLTTLLTLLRDKQENEWVRGGAVQALRQLGQGNAEVLTTLLTLLRDKQENQEVRWWAAQALRKLGQGNAEVLPTLVTLTQDKEEDWMVRQGAVRALRQLDQGNAEVLPTLLTLLRDKQKDQISRWWAAVELGHLGQGNAEVLPTLLTLLQDQQEDEIARGESVLALGQIGQGNAEVLLTLLTLLRDKKEDDWVRRGTALALGQLGQGNAEVLTTLLTLLRDKQEDGWVHYGAAVALGQLGQGNAEVLLTLLTLLRDKREKEGVRRGAALALGQLGQGNAEVLTTLLAVINDKPDLREYALNALWEVVGGNEELRIKN